MKDYIEKFNNVLEELNKTCECNFPYFNSHNAKVPSRTQTIKIIKYVHALMFPSFFTITDEVIERKELITRLFSLTAEEIKKAFNYSDREGSENAEKLALEIVETIPKIKCDLLKDIQAIYEGDPSAQSPEAVILSYPGFFAISIYRIAHEFYIRKIPYIARLMTEYGHEKTGIDIHAGAKIGSYFCIDHGTGIVIGETTTIGDHVKIYQGVTLGAKSFELDENGHPVKGIKRHPDIGSNVIIYANATILGGNTKVGNNCVIGANVWLIHSVEDGQVVYYSEHIKKAENK